MGKRLIIKRYTDSFFKKIWAHIWTHCEELVVDVGECPVNYKCHINTVHHAKKGNHSHIALVFYQMRDCANPSIHFINFDGEKFVDNSIGYIAETTNYYLIRLVPKRDFENCDMNAFLGSVKNRYTNEASFMERLFGDCEV